MANLFEEHIAQWKHNRRFLESIDSEFHDWMITATFYVAVHAVNAVLAYDKVTGIVSHDVRNYTLRRTNRYKQLNKHYQPLYGLARTSRYLASPSEWVPREKIECEVLRRYLYPIEKTAQNLIKEDLALSKLTLKS